VQLLPTFTTGRLPSKSSGATSRRIRRQLRRALPPPLIDDFDDDFKINDFDVDLVPPSLPSTSPTTTATVGRYNPRDLILSFILSNMPIRHTSMLYMLDLVHLFYMIYILFLIWKLLNYLTIQKSYYRPFPELSMASFVDALRPEKFLVHILRGGLSRSHISLLP
jgi:hypothetical protein